MKKKILSFVIVLSLVMAFALPVFAVQAPVDEDGNVDEVITIGPSGETTRLFDGADLLTADEEANLLATLHEVSEKHKVDVAIAAVETIGDEDIAEYAGNYFDQGGCGYDTTKDGVLLLVAMNEGKYYILTDGLAHKAITDSEAAGIGEEVASYLTEEKYVDAFETYVEECEYQINGELNGFPFKAGRNLLISLIIGVVLALIVTGIWKGQLKSVRQQKNATNYTKAGSMQVNVANDFFLYSTITREKKPEKTSSGSSSGGSSRGGAGGSF